MLVSNPMRESGALGQPDAVVYLNLAKLHIYIQETATSAGYWLIYKQAHAADK